MAEEQSFKAGEYRVIGDVLTLKEKSGDKASYPQHKRGEVVKLTAEQAQRYASGPRPLVVPHKGEESAADKPAADKPAVKSSGKSGAGS